MPRYNTNFKFLEETVCNINNSSTSENSPNNCDKEVQTSNSYTNELTLKKKIKFLQQKLHRSQSKVNNLSDLIKNLKSNGHIDSEQKSVIMNNFNGRYLIIYITLVFFFCFA